MDVATALTVAETLFATLQSAEVRKLCSIRNYDSELQKLLDTVNTIKNFLLDADSKCQELTNEGQYWVQNLKDAVYDADDLLDEFNTIAHQLKGMPGGKISKKVRRFFSSNNQLIFAVNMSIEIKKLREKLGSLAKNHSDFGFSELFKPVKIREETCSYVYEQDIIGRDADKETIVDLLLKDDLENDVSFVTIVGIGGLGKTALAQLVFSDHRIKDAFKGEMYWVCVTFNFDTKDILSKIHKKEERTFEDLSRNVREQIEGKRYLLVLDDVWSEDGRKWDELRSFLILGGRGTRILVTSRSRKVAGAIGVYPIHELGGLSVEDSWVLFKKISLGQRKDEAVTDLVEIGKEIVKKCANVPLSIRVTASLLRNQDIATWQSFKSNHLANMCGGEDGIMPTLMFSYYHLAPELKSCFSFCSLFPEDYRINKAYLIRLWMAQGYLVPSAKDESMEDVGENYISVLLHRCFFQDIRRDAIGEVCSFKMHDLMHELARKVAAKESLTLTACTDDLEGKVRHLYIDNNDEDMMSTWFRSSNCPIKTLRTCLMNSKSTASHMDAIISNCGRLRVLNLWEFSSIRNLPDTLGKLSHLRYLYLSEFYELEMIPKSITKLHNLQTLILSDCRKLKELPKDTSKLVNLRVLDMHGCRSLTHMPEDTRKLVNLRVLIVSGCNSLTHMPAGMGELLQLRYLVLPSDYKFEMLSKSIVKLHNLQMLDCDFSILKELPEDTCRLVNLRMLDLSKCRILTHLPQEMGKLLHLRYLNLSGNEELKMLPKSITKLHNLLILNLDYCFRLKELPEDTCKLVNLRVLYIERCLSLTHMPAGLGRLTCLHTLPTFILSKDDDKKGKLRDLAALINNLNGKLEVKDYEYEEYLTSSTWLHVKLMSLKLSCDLLSCHQFHETLMESLFCNSQFQKLEMENYCGTKLPSFSLGLVSIELRDCDKLIYLPSSLSQLCHLKYLRLWSMKKMKYIECSAPSPSALFFPSLEMLDVRWMPALTRWWRDIGWTEKEAVFIPSFPCLCELYIRGCKRLTYIPPCPLLTHLELIDINEALTFCMKEGATQSNSISLKFLSSDNLCVFNSLIRDGLQSCSSSLQKLSFSNCRQLESLEIENLTNLKSLSLSGNIEGMPWESLHALSSLEIIRCKEVTILPKGIQYLTSLQSLILRGCDNLEDLGECFNSLTSLKQLDLSWCKKLKSLPEEMRHLTSLTALKIIYCDKLKSLPEAMLHLTSLTTLEIGTRNELAERCRKPDGEDRPKICHIPNLRIY